MITLIFHHKVRSIVEGIQRYLAMMFGLRRRVFLVQKFIHTLIVTRVFTTHLLSIEIYMLLILALHVAKYFKEGFTPTILALLPILALNTFAELQEILWLQYVATILGGFLHFLPLKLYYLPAPTKLVGMREDALEGDIYYVEFYPLDESKEISQRSIKWHHTIQLERIMARQNISHKLLKKIGHIVMSYANQHHLQLGSGTPLTTRKGIIFSHGRGGTPFVYSSLLMHFAAKQYRIASVQHHEVPYPGLDKEKAKGFREKEVQARAAQLYQGMVQLNTEEFVLMGHSYGCATVVQTYHSLEETLKERVTHIVLLDPWFFPLSDKVMEKSIECPILVLANQDFIQNEDMFERNSTFLALQKAEYIVWKNAHHLHQTDIGFVIGNLMGAVKNSHLSKIMLDCNIDAMDKFLRGETVQGAFQETSLGRNYQPAKFKPDKFMY